MQTDFFDGNFQTTVTRRFAMKNMIFLKRYITNKEKANEIII